MSDANEHGSLRQYYSNKKIQVAFRNLTQHDELRKFANEREEFLTRKLGLPCTYFSGKTVLEFGPGSGENSICFALHGAFLTLVEPDPKSHNQIKSYFINNGLNESLINLSSESLENFSSTELFDFVDAEGFVASIQPPDKWLKVVNNLLKPNGLLLISYFEKHGSFSERFLNILVNILLFHMSRKNKKNTRHIDVTRNLMKFKWGSVGSLRSFDTWYLDHIVNPFAKLNFNLDASDLLGIAAQYGFHAQSSCPNYLDQITVGWYKEFLSQSDQIKSSKEFIFRNCLSFMLGEKIFFTGDARQLEEFYALIVKMLNDLEPFENEEIPENSEALIINLKNIISYLKQNRHDFYADDLPNVLYGLQLLVESIEIAVSGDQDSLENLLVDNCWFNRFWGSPVHYLLLRKVA